MSKLATEYHGFLRFIRRANNEIISWFGPLCNYDPPKIALMAAREWEAMADDEKRYFIKAKKVEPKHGRAPTGSQPYLCYMLHKRHSSFPGRSQTGNGIVNQSLFHPALGRANAFDWKTMPKTEREKYANLKLVDLSIDHLLENREKLHEMYDPRELRILEFILRTRPKKVNNSRVWFCTMESLGVSSPEAKDGWNNLSEEDRRFYAECSRLDRRRYRFEKNAWVTKLLSIDFERDDLSLTDFESIKASSNVETLGSLMELDKSFIPEKSRPKQPLSSFSLFLRDYRYKYRTDNSECKFRRHLREVAKAWAELPDDEKQVYKDISNEMKVLHRQATKDVKSNPESEVMKLLFKHEKKVTGPSKPSHLLTSTRVPNVVDIYGKMMKIRKSDSKKSWDLLSEAEREPFYREHREMKMKLDAERARIKAKLGYINTLIRKSEELERVKKELCLLRTRKANTTNRSSLF